MISFHKLSLITLGCALIGAASCVKQTTNFGYSFIPDNERFVTRYVQINLDSIYVSIADSLDAYNSQRFTIGAVYDPLYGLQRHTSAFNLIPMNGELNWGKNIRNVSMHFGARKDTLSFYDDSREHILQNVRVYSLKDKNIIGHPKGIVLDDTWQYTNQLTKDMFAGCKRISKGVPTYDGRDSLSFDFTDEFAKLFLVDSVGASWEGRKQVVDSAARFARQYPGVFICTDDPDDQRGRINMFKSRAEINSNNYLVGSFVELKFTAEYSERTVDTSFFYALGASSIFTANQDIEYDAFNCCEHESQILAEDGRYGKPCNINGKKAYLADKDIYIEGGAGLKPMIPASYIRNAVAKAVKDTLCKYGITDIEQAMLKKQIFINKAQLVIPFEEDGKVEKYKFYPKYLNPAIRVSQQDTVIYAAITDALVSDENQGAVNYSRSCYWPDIANHLQEILSTDPVNEPKKLSRENLWFTILADETVTTTNVTSQSDSDAQLAYLNYYYSMLSGNYSGSSSYYNYYMLQSLYANSSSDNNNTSVQTTVLDIDRYYNATLVGRNNTSSAEKPKINLVYSFLLPEATN